MIIIEAIEAADNVRLVRRIGQRVHGVVIGYREISRDAGVKVKHQVLIISVLPVDYNLPHHNRTSFLLFRSRVPDENYQHTTLVSSRSPNHVARCESPARIRNPRDYHSLHRSQSCHLQQPKSNSLSCQLCHRYATLASLFSPRLTRAGGRGIQMIKQMVQRTATQIQTVTMASSYWES